MPTLQLQLLGHFQLLVNGAPVQINQVRLQSLLAYLFLHPVSIQTRQHLAFVFWPDSTEAQARANLRKALYDLRRVFPDLDSYLQFGRQDPHAEIGATVQMDVTDFEDLLAQATAAGQPRDVQAALEQAAALYTGDLLPACYDDWVLAESERLRQRYLSGLEQLVYLLEDRREYSSAAIYAEQLLQADPLRESTYRTLMRLHLQDGDRARALRIYHTCVTLLQQELGVEPGPEMQAAYRRLLNLEALPPSQPAARVLPLIGRQREWEALQDAWHTAWRGQPQFVLIAGEAGIGKSRLAEELLQWTERQGYAAARTRSYSAEGQLAYAPIADWLRSDVIRSQLGRLDRVWLSEAARLLPELLVEHPDLAPPQPLTDSWQRQRFREALARAFVIGEQPLLLVLDDLQWCDRETLEWLHYLLRFPARAQLLVVGTVRPGEVEADHPLRALLMDLRQDGTLFELELDPLDAEETAALAALAAGHELDADESASLYAETEGHPLFVIEAMRASEANARTPSLAPPPATGLPPKVQAVIGARLFQLTAATRELVELAAVVGRAFTAEVLVQAGAGDEDGLVKGLDELWRRRIIREQGVNAYDFGHDKIREAAYASISPARRRLLHRQVAQALEQVCAFDLDPVSAQIAAHYERAGMPREAVAYYERAASAAQQVYAHEDAAGVLSRGLALLEHLPATPEHLQQELRLQLALGISLMSLKGMSAPELRDLYQQAHDVAVQVGDDLEQLIALAGLHMTELTSGNVQAAYELSQHEIVLAERVGNVSRLMEARGKLGIVMLYQGQWRASREYLEPIVAYADYQWADSSHPIPVIHWGIANRRHLVMVAWHLGYPDQALRAMDETLTLAKELAHPYTLAATISWSAWLHCLRREPQLAQARAEQGIILGQKHGYGYWLGYLVVIEGWALARQGQVEAGIARMREGLATRLAADAKIHQPALLAMLAETYGQAGQPVQGLRLLDDVFAQADDTGERMSAAELYRLKGELLRMQAADECEVESCFLRALTVARQQEAKSLELRAAMSLSRLWQSQGKRQAPYDLLAESYSWFSEGFDTPDLRDASALLAELAEG